MSEIVKIALLGITGVLFAIQFRVDSMIPMRTWQAFFFRSSFSSSVKKRTFHPLIHFLRQGVSP